MTDSNNNNFKLIELLAYCRREIAQKDKEIHRLQEAIEHAQIVHERKLLSELSKVERKFAEELRCAQQNALELQLSTSQDVVTRRMDEKFGGTNLPTFDGNGIERMENAKSAIAWNDDVQRINMLLKERELVITTTDKVRNELEVEFADKLEHAKRQLQLEHAAQWEADQLMATKMKKEIADLAKQLAECGERSAKSIEELESRLQQSELEKSKLATIVQRGKMQTEKAMAEQRRQAQIATSKQEATIRGLNKQIEQCKVEKEELNRTVVEMKHQNQELNEKYSDEKARSQKIHREHSKLVGKLKELLGFLEKINTTKQIDQPSQVQMAIAVENENDDDDQRDRATVFARIYSILEAVKFD